MEDVNRQQQSAAETAVQKNFLEEIIENDLASGRVESVMTRFPPEPNGYLHIGHAKSICLNFGLARKYGGRTNLRFDDTNPVKEDTEYVDSIKEDIKWLGFNWAGEYYASDYFQQLYDWAVVLIKKGLAYVDDQTQEEIRANRGTVQQPGVDSPWRNRSVEENLDLFERMKNGEFPDGSKVLRAKIDMAHPNMMFRDPLMYRIIHASHHRTGDKWCIYPMYDYAHGQCDSIEHITHSICTLEFDVHRPLYDWVVNNVSIPYHKPRQIEFARLNIDHTVMSKRKLRQLVEQNYVSGWDDPRMPTLCGLRRRGYTAASIRNFCERIGVAKSANTVEYALLEHCLREDLNASAERTMGVLHPVKLVITNYPEDKTETFEVENNPVHPEQGTHPVTFSREVWIEAEDFLPEPIPKYKRLYPNGPECRLKGAYLITCTGCVKDENGNVVIDPETGKPKKDPKTQVPYTVLDDIHEIEALPETTEKEIAYKNFRREAIKPYKQMRIPQPDFVLCCNNICNCMTKWYENIARMCNIPLIMVDIPYNNTVEVSDSAVKYVRAQFDNAIHQLEELTGKKFDEKLEVGTMIEIPRAALTADEIAKEAEFFSFGTNDLTQMTFGFSRDDAAKFLGAYYENKIYESDPFQHLDQIGVGKLVKMAAHDGRETRPDLGLGICGEHGGDPTSVEFCHNVGLDYVSCSPFRVPIARLAAAQAAIKNPRA